MLPRLKYLRWIWTENIRMNSLWLGGPMKPQAIKEEIQHIDELVIKRWT